MRSSSQDKGGDLDASTAALAAILRPAMSLPPVADPNHRWAKDVDILIAPEQATEAINLLHKRGYRRYGKTALRAPAPKRERLRMLFHKDESYIDPKFGQLIELHQRVFYFEPSGLSDFFRSDWREGESEGATKTSVLFYLLLHGAIVRWGRIKWLADMSLLLRKLDTEQLREINILASRFGCSDAVTASLFWVDQVFPGSLEDDVSGVVENDLERSSKSIKLSQEFAKALTDRGGKGKFFLKPNFPTPVWGIFRGIAQKIMLMGYVPLAAMVRRL